MGDREKSARERWTEATCQSIGSLPYPMSTTDLANLKERLIELAWHPDCPRTATTATQGYQRHLLASTVDGQCSVLLIAWPPNDRTPLHDHGGLWGIELVIDGALSVQEYRVGDERNATRLSLERSLMLGIGDAAFFSGRDYVHSCRNLSPNRAALSLLVYGGALVRYSQFDLEQSGQYRVSLQRTKIDAPYV